MGAKKIVLFLVGVFFAANVFASERAQADQRPATCVDALRAAVDAFFTSGPNPCVFHFAHFEGDELVLPGGTRVFLAAGKHHGFTRCVPCSQSFEYLVTCKVRLETLETKMTGSTVEPGCWGGVSRCFRRVDLSLMRIQLERDKRDWPNFSVYYGG